MPTAHTGSGDGRSLLRSQGRSGRPERIEEVQVSVTRLHTHTQATPAVFISAATACEKEARHCLPEGPPSASFLYIQEAQLSSARKYPPFNPGVHADRPP